MKFYLSSKNSLSYSICRFFSNPSRQRYRDILYTNNFYTWQSLYVTKFIQDKVYSGTKFIRDKVYTRTKFIRDKVYTGTKFIRGQSLYGDKVYTNFFHTVLKQKKFHTEIKKKKIGKTIKLMTKLRKVKEWVRVPILNGNLAEPCMKQ